MTGIIFSFYTPSRSNSEQAVEEVEVEQQTVEIAHDGEEVEIARQEDEEECADDEEASEESAKSITYNESASSTISKKLEVMMHDRIEAIDNIRALLEHELEQDNGLLAEFPDKVMSLEQDVLSKNECIEVLNKHVDDLKSKNGDYARELNMLNSTINELVDSNHESISRMVELETNVATKKDTIEEMTDELQYNQSVLGKNIEENTSLVMQLETFKAENDGLKATIQDLQAENTDYADELENLLTSLKELVDQNTALETQVEQLMDANTKLGEDIIPIQQKNAELLDTVDNLAMTLKEAKACYHDEVRENERLKLQAEDTEHEQADMKASVDRMTENHASTIGLWEKRMILEEQTVSLLKEEMEALKKRLGCEHSGKAELAAKVTGLKGSLEEARIVNEQKDSNVSQLQNDVETTMKTLKQTKEDNATTIEQLENNNTMCVSTIEQLENDNKKEKEQNAATITRMGKDNTDIIQQLEAILQDTTSQAGELEKKYHKELERNECLKLDREDRMASAINMVEEHAVTVSKMEASVAAAKEERTTTVTKMNEEHTSTVTNITEEHDIAVAKITEEHDITVSKMTKEHDGTITEMTQDHESTVSNLQTSLEAEIDANTALTQEIEHLNKKLADEQSATTQIAGLHATLESNLEATQRSHKKEKAQFMEDLKCTAKFTKRLDKKVVNLTKSLEEATASYKTEVEKNVALRKGMEDAKVFAEQAAKKMTEEHNTVVTDMETSAATAAEEHNATVSKMVEEHEAAVSKIAEEHKATFSKMTGEHEAAVSKMAEEHRVTVTDMDALVSSVTDEHKATVSKMTEEHKATVSKMTDEHKATVADMEASAATAEEEHEADVSKMTEKHKSTVSKMAEEHKTAATGMEASAATAEEEHEATMSKMTEENEATITDLEVRLTAKTQSLTQSDQETKSLRNQLGDEQTVTLKIAELQSSTESKRRKEEKSNKKEKARLSETIDKLKQQLADRDQIQKELAEMRKQLEDEKLITVQVKELQERLDETERHLSAMTKCKEDLTEKLGEVQELNATLKTDMAESKTSQAELLNTVNKLLERLDEKDDALTNVNNEKSQLVEKVTKMKGANDTLKSEVQVLKDSQVKASKELTELLNRMEEKENVLSNVTTEKNGLVDNNRRLMELSEQLQSEVKGLKESQAKIGKEHGVLQEKFQESQQLVQISGMKKEQLQSKYDDMEQLSKKLSTKLEESKDDASVTISKFHKRLHEMEGNLSSVKSEKATLRKILEQVEHDNKALSTEINESKESKTRESVKWTEEKGKLKRRQHESEKTLVMVAEEKERVVKSKAESEKTLSTQLNETKEKNSKSLTILKAQLEETQGELSSVKEGKCVLDRKLDQLQSENQLFAAELDESKTIQSRDSCQWMEEKNGLTNRLVEFEKSMEMVQKQNTESERKLLEEKSSLANKLSEELLETKGAHSNAISRLQAHLDDTEKALDNIKNDKDTLQGTVEDLSQMNQDVSLEIDELRTLMSRESQGWNEEKSKMIEEKSKLKKRLRESEKTLVMVANQKTALESQQTDLERKLSSELIATKGKHSKTIDELQVRLEDAEHLLSSVKVKNDNLQNTVDDLQQINIELSEEIDESKTNLSSESVQWNGEKEKLKNRLRDSELAMVMVADHKQQLAMQKDELARQKDVLEKKLIEEKKEMMDRQHGLEQMLRVALEGKVEDD